jgi:hypothetical protein
MAVEPRPRRHGAPRPGGPGAVRGTLTDLNSARTQQRLFSEAVTDDERRRMFERG